MADGVQARSEGLGKGSEFEISLPISSDGVKNVPLENTSPSREVRAC